MAVIRYLDTILVPLSMFITFGYHAYLWHTFKKKPCTTTIGMNTLKRRIWLQGMKKGDDKHGMLAVQSLRNTLMGTILTATVTILITLCLAALTNNTYKINQRMMINNPFFGLQSNKILLLKYGSASIFLLASFLCSSMALGNLIDANYLIYALGAAEPSSSSRRHTQTVMERGFVLAVVGNRVLCITFPLLIMWMLGPVMVLLSSLALVWGLYMLDFVGTTVATMSACSYIPNVVYI